MYNKILEKIKSYKNIAILGFGKEGQSTYNFIRRHDKDLFLTILDKKEISLDDKNTKYKKYNGEEDLEEFDLVIKSPGIRITSYSEKTLKKLTSQMELLLEFDRKNVIGVTGTKGKSTTTTLIYNILKDQLGKVYLGGNIGIAVFDNLEEYDEEAKIVIEISALQLETVKYSPHVSVIVNLYLDHLDHFGGKENYHKAKMNNFRFQDKDDYAIYDYDNDYLRKQDFSKIKSNILPVSLKEKTSMYLESNGDIILNDKVLLNRKDIVSNLKGDHNLLNTMFALLVTTIYDLDLKKALNTIKKFIPLEHRMEYVDTINDIIFYNDVIATIPESTINACDTLKDVNTLIFGGMDRNIDYSGFVEYLNNSKIEHFICMPSTGYKLASLLDEKRVIKAETLEEAVEQAYKVTKKNMICLLSPAASSYEFFKNFEEKGKRYKELVRSYK